MDQTKILTSLGFPLEKQETDWSIDLSELKIFKGLSVLAGVIGEIVVDRLEKNPGDVAFLYRINSNINPELINLNIKHIQIYGRADLLSDIIEKNDQYIDNLVTVFGTLQRPTWRNKLYPEIGNDEIKGESASGSTALVFPFRYMSQGSEKKYCMILERATSRDKQKEYFFRLSYEDQDQRVMDLSNIPHVLVDDLKNRVYISGSTRMAGLVKDNILSACNRGIKEYSEENRNYSHLFEQLKKTKLGRLEKINFNWDTDFSRFLSDESPTNTLLIFKKIFLSFEAGSICNTLIAGETVTVKLKWCYFRLYLSQLNRVLNININQPRKVYNADKYLKRMPLLEGTANQTAHSLDFSNIGVFLIHHITSEIVAFIEALKALKAESVQTLFVKYGGVVPADYLDTLLEIPSNFLFTAGLIRKTTQSNRNYYTLSDYLSDTDPICQLDDVLKREKLDFFPAMKLVAGHMFLKFCLQKETENQRVLLIEDGGYLAPVLNELAASDKSTEQVFKQFFVEDQAPSGKLADWLSGIMIGTIEHTKNGYDRLKAVQSKYQKLAFPTFSIAISHNKLKEESQEVAHSILSAIESILHGNGLVLSQRKTVLLGAQGNIGQFLRKYLENDRLHENALPLINIDETVSASAEHSYTSMNDIPVASLLGSDLFIGVTGVSLLKKKLIEQIVLQGEKQKLFFASGSTKTAEFSDLSDWVDLLFQMEHPMIGETPVSVEYGRVFDPQSGFDQGGKVTIRFTKEEEFITKTLYLLNDLTPVNFLYYGVPTETMDVVLNQLLTVSLGMGKSVSQEKRLPPILYAVDHEIDEWGNPV